MKKSSKEKIRQKITPNLWFDNQAEEAVNFYTSIFRKSKISNLTRYGKVGYRFTAERQEQ